MTGNKQHPSRPTDSLGSQIGSSRRLGSAQSFEDAQQGREKLLKILGSAIKLLDDVEGLTNRGSQEEVPSTRGCRRPQSRTIVTGPAMSTDEQSAQSGHMLRASGSGLASNQSTMQTTNRNTKKDEDAATTTSTLDKRSTKRRDSYERED